MLLSDFVALDIAVRFLGVSLFFEDEIIMKLGSKRAVCVRLPAIMTLMMGVFVSHGLESTASLPFPSR